MKSKILPSSEDDKTLGESIGGGKGGIEQIYCWKSGESSETWDKFSAYVQKINYTYIKDAAKWFLDTASLSFSLTIDDLMMAMTLFVLFADNIKILTAGKEVDEDFIIVNTVCLFAFIGEFLLNTWSKTEYTSLKPLKFKGYIFTFFWFLDFVAILSMFPDIPFIANPLGLGGISSSVSNTSGLSKIGRVIRLVRLVRLVKLYKIATERTKRQKLEEDMMENVNAGTLVNMEGLCCMFGEIFLCNLYCCRRNFPLLLAYQKALVFFYHAL